MEKIGKKNKGGREKIITDIMSTTAVVLLTATNCNDMDRANIFPLKTRTFVK